MSLLAAEARLVAFGSFKGDSHGMFSPSTTGWRSGGQVEKFVELSLPVALLPVPPADAESQRLARGRQGAVHCRFRALPPELPRFLDADYRAPCRSGKGGAAMRQGRRGPKKRSLDFCRSKTENRMKLAAVDDDVVWRRKKTN